MLRKWTSLIFVVLVVGLTNSLSAQWTGAVSSDWYNAANWTGTVPTEGDTTAIDSSTPLTWPIIDGGNANTGQLRIGYTADYQGELTVTGGATLNVNGELRIGRKSNDGSGQAVGILNVSGETTTINVTERIEHGRHGHAIINMSGGYLHCDAELRLAYRFDATSTVYLSGGTIDLGGNPGITAYANDGVPDTALIDISGGTLTLAGNQVSDIEAFISEGIIIGYGGEGTVSVTFDGATNTTMIVGVGGPSTSEPDPANEQTDVARDVVLKWKPGTGAVTHDLYFGTSLEDVNNATTTVDTGSVYKGNLDTNIYAVTERLEFGETYYWRVDAVDASNNVNKGDVWNFTVELFAYPVENIVATASSSEEGKGPENTVNGSGLDESGLLHGNDSVGKMWLSSKIGDQPTWIEYEFDKAYKLHEMWVWNSNDSLEDLIGLGFKEVTIEYSADGTDFVTLGTTHEFAQAPGQPNYAHNITIGFGGAAAKHIRLTANSNWGGIFNQFGLSEVRFFSIPVFARNPSPVPGAKDVDVDVTLSWQAGRQAAKYDVYLSTDEQAVIDGTGEVVTETETSHGPLNLDLGTTYYWRVDDVNEAETPTTWQGDIWNLSTQEYLVVDNFESYNDIPDGEEGSKLVYVVWKDGFDNPSVNGSTIGYSEAFQPSMETSIFYDGSQSVPIFYDNTTAALSEVTVNVADLQANQDWSKHSIKALTLQFYGDPNNSVNDQMYIKLNGSKVTYEGDAENLQRIGWQTWYIDLASNGMNLSNITELSIGFERIGTVGGQGVVLLDGIRLYSYDPQVITPTDPGTTGLQAHYEFEGTFNDSSGNSRHSAGMGNPTFVAGKIGQAINLRGLNDYIEITGYKGVLGTNAFSISAWIKTTFMGEDPQEIIYYGTHVTGQRCEFRVHTDGHIRLGNGAGQVESLNAVTDGGWHHVAATIKENATNSSSDVRMYMDGQDDTLESTDPDAFNIVADWDVAIGYRPSQSDRFFMGQVDDVRIYDRVLSQEEIAWLGGRTKSFDKPF
ncbi:MAG: hypothetical protein GY774_25265 [Planctomycetes bacterium]|nr:hypothetical protein [Planctomycetota bacterium]